MSTANLLSDELSSEALFPGLDGRLLVLYDGECGFCNRSIRWLLRRDSHDRLRFAPNNDPRALQILARHGMTSSESTAGPDTIVVFRNVGTPLEDMLIRSKAVLACLEALPHPWRIAATLLRLIPRPFREIGYRQIARIRHRIFGRLTACPLPTPLERRHFL